MLREQLEGLLRAGQSAKVLSRAGTDFEQADSPLEALWVTVVACRAAVLQKRWSEAIAWGDRGIALGLQNAEALGWIQLHLGIAHMYLANVYRAENALDSFQRRAARTPALRSLVAYGSFNQAILMRFMRQYDREIRYLQQAAAEFSRLGFTRQPLQCRLELAWTYLLHNQPALALPELEDAERRLADDADEELRLDAQIMRALHSSLTRNWSMAETLSNQLLSDDRLDHRQKADVLWVLGSIARSRGDLAQARNYGDEAFECAILDYWPLQIERIEALRRAAVAN